MCLSGTPRPKGAKEHPHSFGAEYVGYMWLWHTDRHQLTGLAHTAPEGYRPLYILAWFDDRSHFIVHREIVTNKAADTVAQTLIPVLSHHAAICVLASNMGAEFVGESFQNVLRQFNTRF
jgi:hypothetical protein